MLRGEENLPIHRTQRQHSLLKEEYLARVMTEKIVFLEKGASSSIINVAGHDVPGDRDTGVPRVGEELFGKDLKQWLVANRCDGEFAFLSVVAEARALTAGDEKHTDFTFLQ